MLKLLSAAPADMGKQSEITKISPVLDRQTQDRSDLRFYSSHDGKRTYLRVWETGVTPDAPDAARWYLVEAPPKPAPDKEPSPATKK